MKHARTQFILVLLALVVFGCAGSTTGSRSAALANPAVAYPETMVFSAESAAEPAAAQLEKLLVRLETAQRWGRPLLLNTVFSRLKIPLPEACARWGHVQVIVPEADGADAQVENRPPTPITRFLFVVRELSPVSAAPPDMAPADVGEGTDDEPPGDPRGPENEPGKKTVTANAPIAVHTCAVLLTPGTTVGRLRIGVVPLLASRQAPRIVDINSVESYSLIHLSLTGESDPGHEHPLAGAEWSPDQILLFFGRGTVTAVGEWPGTASPLPENPAFRARLRLTTVFRRLVLVLEPVKPHESDTAETSDMSDTSDTSDTSDASPAHCVWIDAAGQLSTISLPDANVLSREAGFSSCAPSLKTEERDLP